MGYKMYLTGYFWVVYSSAQLYICEENKKIRHNISIIKIITKKINKKSFLENKFSNLFNLKIFCTYTYFLSSPIIFSVFVLVFMKIF